MISQDHITPSTPMGAVLTADGATFRVWAPCAQAVYLNGEFGGVADWTQTPNNLMSEDGNGYWTGFIAGAKEGDVYKFYVKGAGSDGYKRDPYAKELTLEPAYPNCNCIIRDSAVYPWHDASFRTPDYSDMIVYQAHIGVYTAAYTRKTTTFLDLVEKIPYLATLGINVLQPLPVDECDTNPSMGYNGTDYFCPDSPFVVPDAQLAGYLAAVNAMLAGFNLPKLKTAQLSGGANQLKALVDLCHLHGIAVMFDVVYNHAGGFDGDDGSLFFWDREPTGDNNNSLYFTNQGWAGGLSFALWKQNVRQIIINNATFLLHEFHLDGLRYDEVSVLCDLNANNGWKFCQDLTSTLRFINPRFLQNAEFWQVNPAVVAPPGQGGAGFDVTQHDALRRAVRQAVNQASWGATANVSMTSIAQALYPSGFGHAWQAVTCVENHDIVKARDENRIPVLADGSNHRSWYARSRSRVATGLLLTAPGIPQLFMGQEFLEDKQWSDDPQSANLLYWQGLDQGDKTMVDHLRFTREAIQLRWNLPALRGDKVNPFHVHDLNRVMAFHRWLDGIGNDVVVVASLNDSTYYNYAIGFPRPGYWREAFNSDVYDNWVNPMVAGNGGGIFVNGSAMHGFQSSSTIVIPANGLLVFVHQHP
jgi:1,4-alpha-glucan branching enzyme